MQSCFSIPLRPMKRVFFTAIVFLLFFVSSRQALGQIKEIPYTIDDRNRLIKVEEQTKEMSDRLIRVEEQIKALQNEMNTRFEAMDDKINKLYTLMYFVLGGVFGLIGFVIYDRKTTMRPVTRDNRRIKEILYELAKEDEKVAYTLRQFNLL